jgi:hypothetical protein
MNEKATYHMAIGAAVAFAIAAIFVAGGIGGAVLATKMGAQPDGAPIAAPFTDVQGHWAEGFIEEIRLAGLTAGCSADPSMFCPDRPLTRAEAAVFMARLLEWQR